MLSNQSFCLLIALFQIIPQQSLNANLIVSLYCLKSSNIPISSRFKPKIIIMAYWDIYVLCSAYFPKLILSLSPTYHLASGFLNWPSSMMLPSQVRTPSHSILHPLIWPVTSHLPSHRSPRRADFPDFHWQGLVFLPSLCSSLLLHLDSIPCHCDNLFKCLSHQVVHTTMAEKSSHSFLCPLSVMVSRNILIND